jgi:hypothetical protein
MAFKTMVLDSSQTSPELNQPRTCKLVLVDAHQIDKTWMLCNAYDDMDCFSYHNTRGVTTCHGIRLTGVCVQYYKSRSQASLQQSVHNQHRRGITSTLKLDASQESARSQFNIIMVFSWPMSGAEKIKLNL